MVANRNSRAGLVVAVAAVLTSALVMAGCTSGGAKSVERPSSAPSVEMGTGTFKQVSLSEAPDVYRVVNASRELGFAVLHTLPGETVVTSPASAVVALSMLASGAQGETEQQFEGLLGAAGDQRNASVNALVGSLAPYRDDVANIDPEKVTEVPQIHLANQVVLSDKASVESSYLDSLKTWFDAGVLVTDLSSSQGKEKLDQWVAYNTAGLIEKSEVEPSPSLRMVLQNALLFVSAWSYPFDPNMTREAEFLLADGSKAKTDFMNIQRGTPYSKVDGWQMVELPYGSDEHLVARFVLPPEGTDLSAFTTDIVKALEDNLAEEPVSVTVPKLDLSSSVGLVDTLKESGLTAVFEPDGIPGSLSYISQVEDLFVSAVIQQGRVQMDEDGTVAAAVTEVVVETTSANEGPPPIEFTADRPYLVLILDKTVGWDLFQIQVSDPRPN